MLGPFVVYVRVLQGASADHISLAAKRREKQAKKVALAIATLT